MSAACDIKVVAVSGHRKMCGWFKDDEKGNIRQQLVEEKNWKLWIHVTKRQSYKKFI